MAIIVDPDFLNRNEVIFGTTTQQISAYPVGAVVNALYDPELTDGNTDPGFSFNSVLGDFISSAVAAGDILSIKTGADAGHWVVSGVISATELKVQSIDDGDFVAPTEWADVVTGSGIVYDIREPTGGNIADGPTEQVVYSFSKEEWRSDGELFGGDDLIRHEFLYEPLTREQFEIGGGASHDNWDYFSNDTKERIRTGGWDSVNSANVRQTTYAGIVTLGSIETDAQVYYQPSGVDADPVNFVLPGTVNQAILVQDVNGIVQAVSGFDTRSFLKLFVRKKGFTYDQSELNDIGVTQLENIVNRFPLTHVTDPAIVASDAEIVGHDPFTNFSIIDTGSNGVTADVDTNTGTVTAAGENFDVSGLVVGDVIEITGGTLDNGFFEILSIDSATQLTVDTSEHGGFTGEAALTYETHTRVVVAERTDDGTIEEVSAGSGTLTSLAGGFNGIVEAGDILRILEPGASGLEGVYKVLDVVSDTVIGIDTSDQAFPVSPADVIDYEVLEPGMFLQSKAEDIPIGTTTTLTFTANVRPTLDTVDRAAGSWVTDGVEVGDKLTISGSTNNDGDYVVRTVAAGQLELDTEDVLVTEGPVAATATVTRHFTRNINGDLYPFLWRIFGNDATASQIYEFIQRELRRTTDIDNGPDRLDFPNRGDVTDLLMEFATPTGKTIDAFIDDLDANDTNNVTYGDSTETTRAFSFVAAGTIVHNQNLIDDSDAIVRMFFTSVPDGAFGTKDAVLVNDADGVPISYNILGTSSRSFTFDYDNNTQGGRTSSTDAAVTIVAIGLNNAQYVLFTGTITRATGLTFSLVSALERNYSNPA